MISKKNLKNEQGHLLLESLVALSILSILIIVLYPTVVNWLLLVDAEKEKVEISRALYESSIEWPNARTDKSYLINQNKHSLVLSDHKNKVDVHIYEIHFKK